MEIGDRVRINTRLADDHPKTWWNWPRFEEVGEIEHTGGGFFSVAVPGRALGAFSKHELEYAQRTTDWDDCLELV